MLLCTSALGVDVKGQSRLQARFEGGEHQVIGDAAWKSLKDSQEIPSSIDDMLPIQGGKVKVSYGTIVGLAADFFAAPEGPISNIAGTNQQAVEARQSRCNRAFQELNLNPDSAGEVKDIVPLFKSEMNSINAMKGGKTLSYVDFNTKYATITKARFLLLARVNYDHFNDINPQTGKYSDVVLSYIACHQLAILIANDASKESDADTKNKRLTQALEVNAFADHFLTDLFSAGHLRTPRRAFDTVCTANLVTAGRLAKCMHDEVIMGVLVGLIVLSIKIKIKIKIK